MVDVNGDDNYDKEPDHDLRKFIEDAHFVDHFHEKFPKPTQTYTRDKKQLDTILFGPVLVGAIYSE